MSEPRFKPGDRIHDFVVQERLGGGKFGTVYACRWALDDRLYAVKVVDGSLDATRREYLALQTVRHPNIVGCLHAGRVGGGGWYIQCELVEGEPLSVPVRRHVRVPLEQAIDIAMQILSGLDAIHPDIERIEELSGLPELTAEQYEQLGALQESGIVHRDIKPENIIQTPEGRVVIVDFGIASPSGSPIETQSATPGYLPPDFTYLSGDRWRPDVDLYAAGVVAYELICGEHPHGGIEFGSGPKPPPPDVPESIAAWLLRACANRRLDRFPSARVMREALIAARDAACTPPPVAVDVQALATKGSQEAPAVEPYVEWTPWPVDLGSVPDLERAVTEILEVEGPIVCGRLYATLAAAAGTTEPAVRSQLNRLVYRLVRTGLISQVEPAGGGQIDKTVHAGNLRRARELGPRHPWEYPTVEVVELLRRMLEVVEDDEELVADLLGDPWLAASIINGALGLDPDGWEARYFEESIEAAQSLLAEERIGGSDEATRSSSP